MHQKKNWAKIRKLSSLKAPISAFWCLYEVWNKTIYLFVVEFVRFLINIYMKQLGIDHAKFSSEVCKRFLWSWRKQERLLIFYVWQLVLRGHCGLENSNNLALFAEVFYQGMWHCWYSLNDRYPTLSLSWGWGEGWRGGVSNYLIFMRNFRKFRVNIYLRWNPLISKILDPDPKILDPPLWQNPPPPPPRSMFLLSARIKCSSFIHKTCLYRIIRRSLCDWEIR